MRVLTVLLFAVCVGVGQAGTLCDVLTSAACFHDLSGAPDPSLYTNVPAKEIVAPCQKQVDAGNQIENCLDEALNNCNDLKTAMTTGIEDTIKYCKDVTGCAKFADNYKNVFLCTAKMFTELMTIKKDTACTNCVSCLRDKSFNCPGLQTFASDQWSHFSKTCEAVNVTTPDALIPIKHPAIHKECPDLHKDAMQLHHCELEFKAAVNTTTVEETFNLVEYCKAIPVFINCADKVLEMCPFLRRAYDTAIMPYYDTMSFFCGDVKKLGKDEDPIVCDVSKVGKCYANMDATLWKLHDMLGKAEIKIKDVMDQITQQTSIFKDLQTMCTDTIPKINATEKCIEQAMQGCPKIFVDSFETRAELINSICTGFRKCDKFMDMSKAVSACTTTAETSLKTAAADNATTIDVFTNKFCKTFDDLGACMSTGFNKCPNSASSVATVYEQLKIDIAPLCPNFNILSFIGNVSIPNAMKEALKCENLATKSAIQAKCNHDLIRAITDKTTNKAALCSAYESLKTCVAAVPEGCKMLNDEVNELLKQTKAGIAKVCDPPGGNDTDSGVTGLQSNNSYLTMMMLHGLAAVLILVNAFP